MVEAVEVLLWRPESAFGRWTLDGPTLVQPFRKASLVQMLAMLSNGRIRHLSLLIPLYQSLYLCCCF